MVVKRLEYGKRLNMLGYTDLELRRKRGDLIQLFKVSKELDEVDLGMTIGKGMKGDPINCRGNLWVAI